jgi:hypothetical protein
MNVLAILPGFIPSTIIGVLRPLADLERRNEIKFRLRLNNISILFSNDIDWCDVAVFCRNSEIIDLSILYKLKRAGKKIVYEIDDNFEEIPMDTHIGVYHRFFFRLHVLKRFFSLSDITRVYSDRLLQRAVAHGAYPQLIRSYFDKSIIDGLQRPASDGVVRVAYPTGRIDDEKLEEKIFSAVRMILQKYDGNVEFHLWRKSLPRQLSGVKGVVLKKGVRRYDNFIRSFFKTGFDIGLAPGMDVPFFHSKTNNKYREFGGCGIAGIYSNFPPYSNSVTHEHSGLLVGASAEEWASAIERLVLDDKLRARITNNAANDVYKNYSFESSIDSWRECLRLLKDQKSELPEWIPSSKQWPLFAFINLDSANEQKDSRHEYLLNGLSVISKCTLIKFENISEYLSSPIRFNFAACIIFLANEKEMKDLTELLPTLTSAIIDTSTYSDNLDSALRHLQAAALGVPMTFLVASEQTKTSSLIPTMLNCVSVDIKKLSGFVNHFSLAGYPAAYLEIAERHIRFTSSQIVKSGLRSRLSAVPHMVFNLYVRWKRQFDTVFMWIKWRLGFRQF